MTTYPKRLIEVDLPIKRISVHARREKKTHHGHISTLHIWWARRPLAACRAVICASLWPDPADPLCPQEFRDQAARLISKFAAKVAGPSSNQLKESCSEESLGRWLALAQPEGRIDPANPKHWNFLRYRLLDFIADYANWDNSAQPEYLGTSRALTQAAHEALGGAPGTRPLVVDPFAGGGAIPLEALRVGADAFASDLNPVAVLLNKVVLEYIPRYGQKLADEVWKWGQWVEEQAEEELADLYPRDADGGTPIAYLWARTITCEGPGCGARIPLIRNTQLTRKSPIWYFAIDDFGDSEIRVSIRTGKETSSSPTVRNGGAICPRQHCGYTTPPKAVREQLAKQKGGANTATLLAVLIKGSGTRYFRNPIASDLLPLALARDKVEKELVPKDEINPIRPYKNTRGLSAVARFGVTTFSDLYTFRQVVALQCFQRLVLGVHDPDGNEEYNDAIRALLHCAASRLIFQNCSLARLNASRSTIEGAFGKQALQMTWDFAESNPISDGPASFEGALDWVCRVIKAGSIMDRVGIAVRAPAQSQILPDESAEALVTDPPYFAAIPYSDLSNFFYVWERKFLAEVVPELFEAGLVDQRDEIIVTNANTDRSGQLKTPEFFESEMTRALENARRVVKSHGIATVVFADSSTRSWEAILGAIMNAGWCITGSWPIDTELEDRTQAADAASLQSSIHLVCRPRQNPDGSLREDIGDWRDVLQELPERIHQWMPRLADNGVVGADAIFACLGPALEVFSRYSRVEKASGEVVALREYLEHVWAAVAREALSVIFQGADATGFEEDARLTAMWLWTLKSSANGSSEAEDLNEDGGAASASGQASYSLEYDAVRKIAQGLGAHMEQLASLVEIKGDKARLLPVAERAKHLFGHDGAQTQTRRRPSSSQLSLFTPSSADDEDHPALGYEQVPELGDTLLDRVHQSMLLFASGRGPALQRFLVDEGAGRDQRFWRLAQALSALYPQHTEEKRWVDGVMARKTGLGL